MAITRTTIEAVRVTASDGSSTEYPWAEDTWYLIRDDSPFLDLRIRGHHLQAASIPGSEDAEDEDPQEPAASRKVLSALVEDAPAGTFWQRWNLEADLARERRLGEVTLVLKVPKGLALRCYVIPARLLNLSDVLAMVEQIESELGIPVIWDRATFRPDRAWVNRGTGRTSMPDELMKLVDEELSSAVSIRRQPFLELGPAGRRSFPLPENAFISHWAARRHRQMSDASDLILRQLGQTLHQRSEHKTAARRARLSDEVSRLEGIDSHLTELRRRVAALISIAELSTPVSPGPVFQRDFRLRSLLRAFAPPRSETLSRKLAMRSEYPPVILNSLWELWGAVWLAGELRCLGFEGEGTTQRISAFGACRWRFTRGDVSIELDYEPDPVLVDHSALPSPHKRLLPALEWAAKHQELDHERPFLATEARSSPDYLIRITTPAGRFLLVGDACLASPEHHGRGDDKLGSKPHSVEHYRRTVAWATDGEIVRCHPMGGFVLFPPPAEKWTAFDQLPGVRDCTILCPSPGGDALALARLQNLLRAVAPSALSGTPLPPD